MLERECGFVGFLLAVEYGMWFVGCLTKRLPSSALKYLMKNRLETAGIGVHI
jgi:hypothetical protein